MSLPNPETSSQIFSQTFPDSYPPQTPAEQAALREFVQQAPLTYGTWGQLKRLYKAVESDASADPALFGALAARLDRVALLSSAPALPVEMGMDVRGVTSLVAMGRRVYCLVTTQGRTVQMAGFDFSGPNRLKPARLGAVEVRGAHGLLACGPFLCLLGGGLETGTLSIFDPSDPQNPVWRGQMALGGHGSGVGVYPYVYTIVQGQASQFRGLRVVDLTNAQLPQVIGEAPVADANAVAVEGLWAVVAAGQGGYHRQARQKSGGLRVWNVADPRRPRLTGSLDFGTAKAVALRGSLAYVGVDWDGPERPPGMQIVDISDPRRPRLRGFVSTPGAPSMVTLNGDFAYLTLAYGYQQVVDIRQPDHPVGAGQISTYGASAITVSLDTAYVGTAYRGLELYSVVSPGKPARIGMPPSGLTLGYMKRRVRRFLRTVAGPSPDRYAALAFQTLSALAEGSAAEVDPAIQWITADILYGASDRYHQRRHGRGPLVPFSAPRLRLRTREERAPDAWNRHPEWVSALLANARLPWQVQEMALKIVRDQKLPLPTLSLELLSAFAAGPSPLLVRLAVHQSEALAIQQPLPADLAAFAYLKAGAGTRRRLEKSLTLYDSDATWQKAFAQQVLETASLGLAEGALPRRLATACEFVALHYPLAVPVNLVQAMAAALLRANRPGLTALVMAGARREKPAGALAWLQMLDGVPDAAREQAVVALSEGMAGQGFTLREAQALTGHLGSAFIREAGWRLLAASATGSTVLSPLWTSLLDSLAETPALRTAMGSAAALSLLERAGLEPQVITDRLRDRPFLAGLVSAQTFEGLIGAVPSFVTLNLVAAASEAQWLGFRPALLRRLQSGTGLDAFWLAAEAAVRHDEAGFLEQRLLEDAEIAASFSAVIDPGVLSIREPGFGPLLRRWAEAHSDLFPRNSSLLLQAATHVLAPIRDWGLAQVRAVGLDLPFALRLLEAGLPASVEVGREYFFSLLPGDPAERMYALALCDSPFLPVRVLGMEFVTERWATLPQELLLQALFENSHPDMQAFVARLLAQEGLQPGKTVQFDQEVLRARHKGRRAKEQVKARQTLAPTLDAETLLALARSRTPRDAEWALGQLARLALAGQEIEGVSVSGVSGG